MNVVEANAAAVGRLLQLITPAPDALEQEAVRDAVQAARDQDLPLMWAVYQLGRDEAVFAAEWPDVFSLVEQLRMVAANWQADVFFGVQEAEDEALVFECDPRWLLQVAARELSGYGLALWRWQGDNPDLCLGFVCREEDGDLLLQCATALEARLLRVEDEDWEAA
ncbi:hypothetical protein [uncultured Cardiobacterium sp.]|jgi:hypothetical protein|uniref:DUF6630 family protein n=1 Tax=uncultured Cardiobacterium sp. TaxID=417619 RepID=UPI002629AF80|nr:hypothetical protein [uncultured Cardiobacterium sp.]